MKRKRAPSYILVDWWGAISSELWRQYSFCGQSTYVKILLVTIFILSIFSGDASAQYVIGGIRYTCPAGSGWSDPRCIREYKNTDQSTSNEPKWATRWGAIYFDSVNGKVGTASAKASENEAKASAKAGCRAEGGSVCEESITYFNQCAVFAWGDRYAVAQGAETMELASRIALKKCGSHSSDCQIYYADCSFPERLR